MSAVSWCYKKCVILVCPVSDFSSPFLILLPLTENWQYIHTECANGWWPHNGFCYRVLSEAEAGSWEESARACGTQGANLTSLNSLSEVEMLLNLLANCKEHHAVQIYGCCGYTVYQGDAELCSVCANAVVCACLYAS